MVTQKDIATKLGVSISLVSRVLSGKARDIGIAEETIKMIEDAAREANYVPNSAALNLKGVKTRTLGVVTYDFEDPYLGFILAQLQKIAHEKGTAHPSSVKENVWQNERHPIISNVEIEGAHPEADGIEITGVFQPRLDGVLLHRVRHGVILTGINRNVIISNCNIYHNTGIGVYCKDLNLHQINIIGNHISYNRLGGIRIEDSEIRNLQITGN